jgi:hypothetical protein
MLGFFKFGSATQFFIIIDYFILGMAKKYLFWKNSDLEISLKTFWDRFMENTLKKLRQQTKMFETFSLAFFRIPLDFLKLFLNACKKLVSRYVINNYMCVIDKKKSRKLKWIRILFFSKHYFILPH